MGGLDLRSTRISARRHHERGATYVEYALLVLVIAVVCVAAVVILGGGTGGS